ncbi:MAG: phosphomannomutase/phosphoglucomutase [Gammaproteobacteria bacterium]|nr:phosphomannomutase/phosphoglucomutase [Gammaproteobacteria bacterium]
MLKFVRQKPATENPQGISSKGNVLHKLWITALVVILVPTVGGFGYLLLLREADLQDRQIRRVTNTYAVQQSANVELLFRQVQERLAAAARSPLAISAVTSSGADDIALFEKAMMDYFPGAVSLRVVPIGAMGTAGLKSGSDGLRNHIEVDLLRRAGEGEDTSPESYQFEGAWLTSLAQLIVHPRGTEQRAVILGTFDNQVISDVLGAMHSENGRSSLQQVYRNGNFSRTDEIAVAGTGDATDYETRVELNSGRWHLIYTPSNQLLSTLQIDTLPVTAVMVVTIIASLGALFYLLIFFQRFLVAEVERIGASAEKKTPLELGMPVLVPLAKQLRRATQRQAVKAASRSKRKVTRRRTEGDGGLSDPMFQKTSMIDEFDDELDRDEPVPAQEMAPEKDSDLPIHIFRAYDIRGLVDSELNEELITRIGGALGTLAQERGQQAVIVACDGRNSSPGIKNTLVKSLLNSGRDVIDIGVVPTPLLYYATHTLDSKSGVMITGSHNPPEYNGLKIVINGKTLAGDEIQNLLELVQENKFSEGSGRLLKQDVVEDYIETIVADMAIAVPLKVVVDAGNGLAGAVAPELLEELGCEVVPMYCDIDGTFPNHNPDPSVDANLADLQARVKAEKADLGVAFDGDGDRLAIISPEGEIIRTDKLLMLFAQDIVARNPGADIIFDVKCSRHLIQLVSRYGGRPILWRSGHSFMKEKMLETGALLGGEFSGHIFFGERWFGFDDGMYAAARLAEILSSSESGLAPLLEDFPETESTPEIRIPVSEGAKFKLVEQIIEQGDFSPGKITTLDGIRVDYNDGWGLLRASNTLPALTARFEARDTDALERIMQQFRTQIALVDADLDPGF